MNRTIQNEVLALLQRSEQAQPMLITDAHLTGLPEPVQRYLRYAHELRNEMLKSSESG